MQKVLKIVGGLLLLVVGLLVALVVLVKVVVTPERVKGVVLPQVEKVLHRPVSLGEISVGLFSGIELRALSVGDPGESEPLVAAERVLLRFQWLPLLSKRVVIDEVVLEGPRIRLIRRADGSLNISDLLAPQKAAGAPGAEARSDAGGAGKAPLDLLVSAARISNGRLAFADRQTGGTVELTALDFDATGISRASDLPIKLSARLQGAPVTVSGTVSPLQKSGRVDIDLQGLDVTTFEPYYRGKIPGKLGRLLLDVKGDFSLQGKSLAAKGEARGREINLFILKFPTAPLQNASVESKYDLNFNLERDHLSLAALNIIFNGLAAEARGEISRLRTEPAGDLKITVPGLDLARLKSSLPPAMLGKIDNLALAGILRVTATLKGPLNRPQLNADVRGDGFSAKGVAVDDLAANLALHDEQLTVKRLVGRLAGGSFESTARLDLHQGGLPFVAGFKVQGVDAPALLAILAPSATGSLLGRLDLQGDLSGRGAEWARTLSGDVTLNLADGKLVSSALVKGFASFLQLAELNEIPFRECRGKALLNNGIADIDGAILSDKLKLYPRGPVGLDGRLDLGIDTRLSPALTSRLDRKGDVTRYLVDADGWSQVPLLLSGTVQAPRYGFDPKGLKAQAGKVLRDEVRRGVDKWLEKKGKGTDPGTSSDSPSSPPPDSGQRLLQDSLKKVFGR